MKDKTEVESLGGRLEGEQNRTFEEGGGTWEKVPLWLVRTEKEKEGDVRKVDGYWGGRKGERSRSPKRIIGRRSSKTQL